MIVPMKKIFLVVQKKDVPETLHALKDAGIVHVEYSQTPTGDELDKTSEDIQMIEQASVVLKGDPKKQQPLERKEWKEKAQRILVLRMTIEALQDDVSKSQALIQEWEKWGNFEPEDIETLKSKGIYVKLYEIPKQEMNKMAECIIPGIRMGNPRQSGW